MKLCLKNGGKQRHLTVNLVEGHIPKVNDLSSNETKSITENLESAIWFKVMVVKSIHVDCIERVVEWSNGKKDEGNIHREYLFYNLLVQDRVKFDNFILIQLILKSKQILAVVQFQ